MRVLSSFSFGIKFYLCYRSLNPDTMSELNDALYSKIQGLCSKGDEHAGNGNYAEALNQYWKAFDLVPEPKTSWEATTWILVAIGDANFLGKDFQAGMDNLSSAMHCPGAIGNPFVHLRLGQCQFELGNLDRSLDELTRAYAIEGEEIFEDDDPKYIQFLRSKIRMGQ